MLATALIPHLLLATLTAGYSCWPHQKCNPHGGHPPPPIPHAPWPSQGIARSPCPALNTLANEQILPYSGRNITAAMAITAVQTGLNFQGEILTEFGFIAAALAQCTNLTHAVVPCTAFDLDMLNIPHAAEHDGSLSREDFNFGHGDNHDFSPTVWGQVTGLWAKYNASVVDFSLAQTARVMRFAEANATDVPGWFEAVPEQSLGESAFYLSVFGDPVKGNARVDWVDFFFQEEKLPYGLGWNASQRELITAELLLTMMLNISSAEVLPWN